MNARKSGDYAIHQELLHGRGKLDSKRGKVTSDNYV